MYNDKKHFTDKTQEEHMIFGGYNITAEIISLIICIFLALVMIYSNPRKTLSYQLIYYGVLLSVAAILCQAALITTDIYPDIFEHTMQIFFSALFLTLYLAILCLLYTRINLLSTKIVNNKAPLNKRIITFITVYAVGCIWLIIRDFIHNHESSASIIIDFYTIAGLIMCILCFISILRNRRSIPAIMCKYSLLFISIDFAMLTIHYHIKDVIFTSLTYVLPFLVFYILFHSNPYDEIIGCQNQYSFEARFSDSVSLNRKFLVMDLRFPQLSNVNYAIHNERIEEGAAAVCRKIEMLHNMIHIYKLHNDEYAIILYIKDDSKIRGFLDNVEAIISDALADTSYRINYKIVALQNNPVLSSSHRLNAMAKFLFNKIDSEAGNACYLATDQDYKQFHESYKIEQLLLDIRNKSDLDDSRVLCYAQPIFSVKENSFRTAEALMRLSLDGTVIYPDKFIPLAESNNCIHTLTRIILNKACKIIHEFENDYDFDALTINCSSSELSDRNLFNDLMGIINDNGINPEHIRLELTESAMFDDFETVLYNMEKLNQSGIKFYLDDFGTGYSNIERIIGCPFYTIKFDKSLLYKALNNDGVSDLMSHMISVFKKQGLVLLIEGVEDDTQNSYCIEQGFDYIQGYKYSKPHPVIELKNYFNKKSGAAV